MLPIHIPGGHLGTGFLQGAWPRPWEVGWAAKPHKGGTAAGGLVWWGLGSIRGPLRGPSPTREVGREAELGDPALYWPGASARGSDPSARKSNRAAGLSANRRGDGSASANGRREC